MTADSKYKPVPYNHAAFLVAARQRPWFNDAFDFTLRRPIARFCRRRPPQDPESEAAWEQEIGRRVKEIRSGTAKLIPAEEVFAETARSYK